MDVLIKLIVDCFVFLRNWVLQDQGWVYKTVFYPSANKLFFWVFLSQPFRTGHSSDEDSEHGLIKWLSLEKK